MKPNKQKPFYRQLIAYARNGFFNLDEESQAEVKRFIREQQSANGGFCDRAGIPDVYYSLFGFFLSEASGLTETKKALLPYVGQMPERNKIGLINRCCIAIIGQGLNISYTQRISDLWGIIREFLSASGDMSRSYQFFMVFLAFDAYGLNNRLTRLVVKPLFRKQKAEVGFPCPVVAALMVLKSYFGLPVEEELSLLMDFFDEKQGFKSFKGAQEPDLLSTAVALVALVSINYDLRLIRPACLGIIEKNYHSGAFLAGNGDMERDTEYTFYGLLALGLMA